MLAAEKSVLVAEVREQLERALVDFVESVDDGQSAGERVPLTPEARAQLEALGYVAD